MKKVEEKEWEAIGNCFRKRYCRMVHILGVQNFVRRGDIMGQNKTFYLIFRGPQILSM